MRAMTALKIILGLAVFGTVFSGVLTYRELFGTSALSWLGGTGKSVQRGVFMIAAGSVVKGEV